MKNFEQPILSNEEVGDKKIENLKEDFLQFLVEEIDESKLKLGDVKLFNELKTLTKEYQDGQDIHKIDIFSFTTEELKPLWDKIDDIASKRFEGLKQKASEDEKELLSSGKWQYSFDGRIVPKTENPCVLGGLHGDETSLPNEMRRLMQEKREYENIIRLGDSSYLNYEVNQPALDNFVRAYSVDLGSPDKMSDINRGNISDSHTKALKERIIKEIVAFNNPFILDLHNKFQIEEEAGMRIDPFGYVVDRSNSNIGLESSEISGDLIYKIKIAQELGLHHLIILPDVKETKGFVISEGREVNKKIDGISVEVDINDKENTSSKLALRFLQMNNAVNNGRPSAGLQMQHAFCGSFVSDNPGIKIFKFDECPQLMDMDPAFEEEQGVKYSVTNGLYIRIQKLSLEGHNVSRVPLNDDDLKILNLNIE